MKIYNEVVSTFNELTGQWETISEDSYEHSGEVIQLRQPTQQEINLYDLNGDGVLDMLDIVALVVLMINQGEQ